MLLYVKFFVPKILWHLHVIALLLLVLNSVYILDTVTVLWSLNSLPSHLRLNTVYILILDFVCYFNPMTPVPPVTALVL